MTEEEQMAKEIDEVVETLKELEPVSIVLMGSFARQEWTSKSDAELAVIFEDANYHSRTELKKYGSDKVRIYPFRLSELLGLRSVIPFPRKFYFWWLKNTAKTLWGKEVLSRLKVKMEQADWRENIVFQKGVALSALLSFRNNDLETAGWAFSKSCLFATVSTIALIKGKEIKSFREASALATKEFPDFQDVIKKAESVWQGKFKLEEKDIFRNFEYFSFLENI
ncbi:MAG: nucleotidyltransferase domain-containing protein [Candidatus Liptonbacteria bacterium]|nr:nucleotidyltransferase domain-containing protein [Candidatus Liptonbacteria bacterium]